MERTELEAHIHRRLRRMIKESGMTYARLSQRTGVSESTIAKLVERPIMPGAQNLALLCKATHTNPAWVLGLSERRELHGQT